MSFFCLNLWNSLFDFWGVLWPSARNWYRAPVYNAMYVHKWVTHFIWLLCIFLSLMTLKFSTLGCTFSKVLLIQTWCFFTYNILQFRQCMYNLTLMYVKTTIVAAKSSMCYIFWTCVCSLIYPIWNVLEPFGHLWLVQLYFLFSTLSHKWHDFREEPLNIKCVLVSSTNFVSNISHSRNN